MEDEVDSLLFEEGDHITYPLNDRTPSRVEQLHERVYLPVGDTTIPVASEITEYFAYEIVKIVPELEGWYPYEAGFQIYRNGTHWISPHRDRESDQKLSITLTVSGSTRMNMYRAKGDAGDYRPENLELVESYITNPGTVMFLRAPGWESGERIIHEVEYPTIFPRKILNLRARDSILDNPKEFERRRLVKSIRSNGS